MINYDKNNKIKEKYESLLKEKEVQINALQAKVDKLSNSNDELRKKLYDAGQGKGEVNKYKKEVTAARRDLATAENKLKEVDGSKLISQFSQERQNLVKNINNIHFDNKIYDALATKFKSGLREVIEIAYRIKMNYADDMDFYAFSFRDNIVGLFEKMLHLVTGEKSNSASSYMRGIISKKYSFEKNYTKAIPLLTDDETLTNILYLLELQTDAYHGNNQNAINTLHKSGGSENKKSVRFFNLDNEKQLNAIFTLLEFMYLFFSCEDWEDNLLHLSSCWFKTI